MHARLPNTPAYEGIWLNILCKTGVCFGFSSFSRPEIVFLAAQ